MWLNWSVIHVLAAPWVQLLHNACQSASISDTANCCWSRVRIWCYSGNIHSTRCTWKFTSTGGLYLDSNIRLSDTGQTVVKLAVIKNKCVTVTAYDGNRIYRYFYSSPPGRFATTLDDSLPGRFATTLDDSLSLVPGRFATWTLRYLDGSLPGHFAPLDVSIPGMFHHWKTNYKFTDTWQNVQRGS